MAAVSKRARTRFVVLPPTSGAAASRVFRNVEQDTLSRNRLISEMQRFRGAMYLRDGAIQKSDLTADGRHKVEVDDRSWHVLSLDPDNRVCACLRFLDETYAAGFDDLCVRSAALTDSPELGGRFRTAVEGRMREARRMGMIFGEVGGWAVAEERRHTLEPLRIVLAAFALVELMGGSIGVATATYRHESAPMLRRIGLRGMLSAGEELPSYYDPHYGCQMQVLQFDSRHPNPKYRGWIAELENDLTSARVVCREMAQVRGAAQGKEVPQSRLLPQMVLAPPLPA